MALAGGGLLPGREKLRGTAARLRIELDQTGLIAVNGGIRKRP